MKNNWLKYSLIMLWLVCYFAFKKAYLADSSTKVAIHLGVLEYDDQSKVNGQWRSCLSYLSKHSIPCTMQVSCRSPRENAEFETWLKEMKKQGHQVIHKRHTIDKWNNTPLGPTFRPLQISLIHRENELSPSLPAIYFRDHFTDLAKSTNFFMVKDDPSRWNDEQLAYFKENIGYLLYQGINFVHLEKGVHTY